MPKILVTGGAGFIGSHLVDKLVAKKHQVAVVDDLSFGKKEFVNPQAKFYQIDIREPKLADVFAKEKPEVVFHLAAQKSVAFSSRDPIKDADINILGALNVINCSLAGQADKFIFFSTGGAIYGEAAVIPTPETAPEIPSSPYGNSKLATEKYLLNYYKPQGLQCAFLRPANVYGPRQDPSGEAGVIATFIKKMLAGEQCYINGSGEQTRDFVYVDDVVKACLMIMEKCSGIYNIATSQEITINNLYSVIANMINKQKPIYHPPIKGETHRSCLSIEKVKSELGWQPEIDLEQGIKKTISYFKD